MLGISQPKTLTTITTTKSSAVDWRWLAAALAVTVGLIAWSATSGGSNEESETAENGRDSSTTVERSSTTTPATTEPATTTSTTSELRPNTEAEEVSRYSVDTFGNGGPLFDEPIGFRIVASGSNRLVLIDPEAGTATTNETMTSSVQPLAVVGEWLFVSNESAIARVPLASIDSEPTLISPQSLDRASLVQPTGDDGTIWVQQFSDSSGFPTFVRLDVGSGTELDRVDWDTIPTRITTFNPPIGDQPMLAGAPAGGTYEIVADSFRRTTEAHLLTAGIDHVLVSTCDDRLVCQSQWLDRRTWGPIDRQVPRGPFDLVEAIDGTDWLMLTSFSSGGSELYNTSSGTSIALRDRFFGGDWRETMAISPDGRWMATRVGILIELTNLETGEEQMIDGIPTAGRVVFVDADAGFEGNE